MSTTLSHRSRGIRTVRRFTAEEDAVVESLRIAGASLEHIGRSLTQPRRRSTVQQRLDFLARRAEAADA